MHPGMHVLGLGLGLRIRWVRVRVTRLLTLLGTNRLGLACRLDWKVGLGLPRTFRLGGRLGLGFQACMCEACGHHAGAAGASLRTCFFLE